LCARDGRRGERQEIFADQIAASNRELSDNTEGESEIRCILHSLLRFRLRARHWYLMSPFSAAGGSRIIGDHVTAGEEDDGATEGDGKEDPSWRSRIRGAVDKSLIQLAVFRRWTSNTILHTWEHISREITFIFTIFLRERRFRV